MGWSVVSMGVGKGGGQAGSSRMVRAPVQLRRAWWRCVVVL